MFYRVAAICAAFFMLSGCITVENPLTAEQVAAFKLAGVQVSVADDAKIWWGDGERAFAATKGVAAQDAEAIAATPEGQTYLRRMIATKMKSAFEKELASHLNGTRPVVVNIVVREIRISSDIERILIGGGHVLKADVALRDAKTGAVLASFNEQSTFAAAGQGIMGTMLDRLILPEPVDRVSAAYAFQYRIWLMRSLG
jgi:hypothetical protein